MLTFELLGNNVQLPEVVYLPLLAYTILNFRIALLKKIQWNGLDTAVVLYGTAVVLAWAIHRTHNAFGEVVACGYLMSLYGVLRYWQVWNTEFETSEKVKFLGVSLFDIRKIVLYSSFIAAVTGIIGYFLAYFGIQDLVRTDGNYPFLGEVFRIKGFFANPIFFVTHVGCVLLLFLSFPLPEKESTPRRWWNILLFLLLFSLFLTKIKSLLSLFGILCFIFAWFTPKRWQQYGSILVGAGSIVVYLFFSHWLILDSHNPNFEKTLKEPFYSTNHTWTPLGSHYALMPTFYYARKELAYIFGKKAFPWGIGGNELYVAQDSLLEAKGMDLMRENAPHSTFWGVFAELGLLGMVALFALFWASFQAIRTHFNLTLQPYYLGILAFLFLEAVTVDLMNVRILWVLLAMLTKFRVSGLKF